MHIMKSLKGVWDRHCCLDNKIFLFFELSFVMNHLPTKFRSIIAVIRQQFVIGINCSIFLYRNSFGANQRLALTRKSLQNCAGFTLCSSAGLAVGECSTVMGLTPSMLCVQIYCVLCVLDYYLLNSQL